VKRVKIVQLIGIILFVVYIVFILLSSLAVKVFVGRENIIFSIILAMLSITLIYKGTLLKSSSTLWFAINLVSYAILIVVFEITQLKFDSEYYLFAIIPIFASLINIAVFNYLIYIKVILLNLSIILPIIIYRFTSINLIWTIVIACSSIILGIVLCRTIYFKREKF